MVELVINVPGVAKGKERPRFNTKTGHAYTPAATVTAENWLKTCAVQQHGQPMLEGPLKVAVYISVAIPKSWSKKKQQAALVGEIWPTGKPDIDNVVKLAADSLNGIIWQDDSQIVDLRAQKFYSAAAGTQIVITTQ